MSTALAVLVLLHTPATIFEKSLSAYSRLRELNARIEIKSVAGGQTTKGTITLLSDAKGLVMRIQEAPRFGYDRTDRTYRVLGNRLEGYDAVANERLTRELPPLGSPADRLAFALGSLEEAPAVLLKRQRMEELFARLRSAKGWKVSSGPVLLKLTRTNAKPPQQVRVSFGAKDNLLRELWMKGSGNELHWLISYGGPKSAFRPLASARRVSAFTVAEMPPKFADAGAKSAFERMLMAGANLKSGTVIVKNESETVRVAFQGNSVREGKPGFVWLYDGRSLFVHNGVAKRFYRGRALRSDVIDLVAKCGGRVDAFSRYLLLRRVPFKDLLPSTATVSVGGSMSVGGVTQTILQANAPGKRFSFSVRGDTHLPSNVQVSAIDQRGQVISTSTRLFEYLRINKAQPAEEFRLSPPKSIVVQPLPKLR